MSALQQSPFICLLNIFDYFVNDYLHYYFYIDDHAMTLVTQAMQTGATARVRLLALELLQLLLLPLDSQVRTTPIVCQRSLNREMRILR